MDCLFCRIAGGEVPSRSVYEDKAVFAFYDIHPQAPVHILVIPKRHIGSADEVSAENSAELARIFEAIPKIAAAAGLQKGYRLITNIGEHGCQSVRHLHFHLLGGQQLPERMC
ncbi:MAG: histidine triad nucleotide-binding protein [Eubacteriales bacterium]